MLVCVLAQVAVHKGKQIADVPSDEMQGLIDDAIADLRLCG